MQEYAQPTIDDAVVVNYTIGLAENPALQFTDLSLTFFGPIEAQSRRKIKRANYIPSLFGHEAAHSVEVAACREVVADQAQQIMCLQWQLGNPSVAASQLSQAYQQLHLLKMQASKDQHSICALDHDMRHSQWCPLATDELVLTHVIFSLSSALKGHAFR